jgi:hypothetical protein
VVSKAPKKDIINNSDAIGRVAKWGIELASFDIDYNIAPPSSLRLWRNSWRIGRKHRRLCPSQYQSIG